jgi:hypothetical protein
MLSMVHQFYAMASDCAVHLCGETAEYLELFAAAAEAEVRRIEARYSRYRGDSEIARINKVAATGGVIDIDAETAGLISFAKACFSKSDGAFDITSGLLRTVWDFSASRLPAPSSINAVLPFIGLDNVALVDSQLHFRKPGMELDFGDLGKEYAADRAAEVCVDLGARHGFIDLGGDICPTLAISACRPVSRGGTSSAANAALMLAQRGMMKLTASIASRIELRFILQDFIFLVSSNIRTVRTAINRLFRGSMSVRRLSKARSRS